MDSARIEVVGLTEAQVAAVQAIVREVQHQNAKWGDQTHRDSHTWYVILGEEVGEVARAILEGDMTGYRSELADTAAVAANMLATELAYRSRVFAGQQPPR